MRGSQQRSGSSADRPPVLQHTGRVRTSLVARARLGACAALVIVSALAACKEGPAEPKGGIDPVEELKTIALDTFARTSVDSWGAAPIGGTWIYSSHDRTRYQVDGSVGKIIVPGTSPQVVLLDSVDAVTASGTVSFSIDQRPDNPERFHKVEVYTRRRDGVAGENYYRYSVRAFGTGQIDLRLEKSVEGVNAWVSEPVTIATTWQPGDRYWIRWDALGTSPTAVLRMKLWQHGAPEPSTWQLVVASNEPALDAGGTIGFRVSGPSADQVTYPITFAFDDLELEPVPAAGNRPTARFTTTGLSRASVPMTFDASTSAGPAGDQSLTYQWEFGDGAMGSGVTATHTYTAAGSYTVRLTVIDGSGAASTAATATLDIQPGDPNLLVSDSFTRQLMGRWGSADAGGVWNRSSTPGIFDVGDGRGMITARPGSNHNIVATTGYGVNVTGLIAFGISKAPDEATRFHTVETYARRDDRVRDGFNYYRYRVRLFGNGAMDLRLLKTADSTSEFLTDNVPITGTWQVGKRYWIRWEAVGTSPATTLAMKVWEDGTAEPAAWQLTTTVDEPRLDGGGTTGVRVEASPWASAESVVFQFDDLTYRVK